MNEAFRDGIEYCNRITFLVVTTRTIEGVRYDLERLAYRQPLRRRDINATERTARRYGKLGRDNCEKINRLQKKYCDPSIPKDRVLKEVYEGQKREFKGLHRGLINLIERRKAKLGTARPR